MEHYFSKKPESILKLNLIYYKFGAKEFKFHTSSSVFSKKRIDKGTDLLIRECRIKGKERILDLGCGYGPVGVVISKIYPECELVMSDINERALTLAKRNLKLNGCKADVVQSNLYDGIKGEFDLIFSNPPQSAGKDICFRIITDALGFLKKRGSLQLVARHQKGGKDLAKKMEGVFGNVSTLGRKSGYHIYCSEKTD